MPATAAELGTTAQLSDPLPGHCSRCLRAAGGGTRFVDFRAAFNGGTIVEEGTLAIRDSIDELHLCEACVREGAEVLGYKPQLHARQLQEIRRLELEREHWRDTARRLKDELDAQFAANLRAA